MSEKVGNKWEIYLFIFNYTNNILHKKFCMIEIINEEIYLYNIYFFITLNVLNNYCKTISINLNIIFNSYPHFHMAFCFVILPFSINQYIFFYYH